MSDLEQLKQKQKLRYWLLKEIYNETNGNTDTQLLTKTFFDSLDAKSTVSLEKIEVALKYLENEGLIEYPYFQGLAITHEGIREFEDSLLEPNEDTEHFLSIVIQEYHEGDKYQGISNSTIINHSTVRDSLNNIQQNYDDELFEALKAVSEAIEKFGDKNAKENFEAFSEEMAKNKPRPSVLKSLWSAATKALPTSSQILSIYNFIENHVR